MKKITIGLLLTLAAYVSAFSQDYAKVRTPLILSAIKGGEPKLEDAKTEIDKLSTNPKSQDKAETYLLKAEVYGSIAGSETLKTKYPQAAADAWSALQKYLSLEPSGAMFKEDNYTGINGLSNSFSDQASGYFNKKNWDSAYIFFTKMLDVSDVMIKNKWVTVAFDTTINLYAGISAQNAGKEDDAARIYEKLAPLKLKEPRFEHIDAYLAQYYTKKKDAQNFKKYLAWGRELYPEKPMWDQLEFEYNSGALSVGEVSNKFDEDLAANRLTSASAANYGDYFLNDKKIKDLKPEDKRAYTNKGAAAFRKAMELDPGNVLMTYNAAVSSYAVFQDADESARAIKGITPEIKSRRAQADKVAMAASDKAVDLLEQAYKQLDTKAEKSKEEKSITKSTAKFLAAMYDWKREKAKGKPADYDMYDKKMQFYDKKY